MKYLISISLLAFVFASLTQLSTSNNDLIQHHEVAPTISSEPLLPSNADKHSTIKPLVGKRNKRKAKAVSTAYKGMKEMERALIILEEQGGAEDIASAYFQLAQRQLDSMQYDKAINYFLNAEQKGFQPLNKVYFQLARAYAFKDLQLGTVEDYLKKARQHGFRNYRALLYDKAFSKLRKTQELVYIYTDLFGSNQKAMFKLFCYVAPRSKEIDFSIDTALLFNSNNQAVRDNQIHQRSKPTIPFQFSAFIEGVDEAAFSRSGGDDFRFEYVRKATDYVAVLYSRTSSWSEYILPKQYRLITFDREGNKISELLLAKRGSLSTAKGFEIRNDESIDVIDYQLEWKKDVAELAFKEGRFMNLQDLKNCQVFQKTSYSINRKGRIEIQESPLFSMR